MIRKAFEIGGGLLLALSFSAAMAAQAELQGARLVAAPDAAQLTLDVLGGTTQRVFTLERPRRTVIDLPHTRLAPGLRMPAASGVVSDLRVGHQSGGTVRIVMQLRAAVAARSVWVASAGS